MRHFYRLFEELFKSSLRKWLFKEPWFEKLLVEPELVHVRITFFEEVFKEMVLQRTLVGKVLSGTINGALKNIFL